jgi:hypothetical protein
VNRDGTRSAIRLGPNGVKRLTLTVDHKTQDEMHQQVRRLGDSSLTSYIVRCHRLAVQLEKLQAAGGVICVRQDGQTVPIMFI